MSRIFIGGNFFGAGNFGDDLTLAGFLHIAARYPGVEIIICSSHDRAAEQRRFPQVRWLPDGDAVRDDALWQADLWLGLGDTPFQLDSGPWLLDHNERERQRCAALGKPMYLLGVGCESHRAAADPRSRALLAAAERVWTRDEPSAAALRPFIAASRLSVGADLAHLVFDETFAPEREPNVVGLLLAFERREQFDLDELEIFVSRRANGSTRWLVQEERALPYLERWILANLGTQARSQLSVQDLDYATSSIEGYLRAFGAPDVIVTSRYHGALVAAWHGSKALVVSRSAKLQGIAEQFDLPHLARLDSHAALEAALETAVRVPRERLREVREGARAMCESFFETCVGRKDPVAVSRAAGANRLPASSNPLPHESLRATIVAEIPRSLRAGEVAVVRCSVTNRGNASYISAPPNPVQLCYRWYDEGGNPRGAGTWIHTALPRALGPGETASAAMRVGAPPLPGSYTLAVTLLQENVAWFDDVDPASRACGEVTIDAAAGEPAATEPFFRLSLAERRDLTRRALETRTPLLVRWGRIHDNWQNDWAYRATLAAEWLTTARSVADLGCGGMTLEPYLLPSQTYVPVDIVARDDRTIILDLEKDDLSGIAADACVLLGVVSYLFDVPAVLVKLHAAFDRIVLSYHVCAVDEIDSRLENGWVNHFRYDELKALFQAARFTVVREAVIEDSEYLFELVPAG